VVGLESDRLAVCGDRLLQLPLAAQGDSEVVVGSGDVGLEPDRLTVFGDRFIQSPLIVQGGAQVGVGLSQLVLDQLGRLAGFGVRAGLAKLGDRVLQLPLGAQCIAKALLG
jgi:hypothetical protein